MIKDLPEGQTHSYGDGCGESAHNAPKETTKTNEISSELVEPQSIEEDSAFEKIVNRMATEFPRTVNWNKLVAPYLREIQEYAKGEYERGKNEPKVLTATECAMAERGHRESQEIIKEIKQKAVEDFRNSKAFRDMEKEARKEGRRDIMYVINDTATFLSGGRAKTAEEFRDEVKEKLAQKVNSA
jgi:hypothetical protein